MEEIAAIAGALIGIPTGAAVIVATMLQKQKDNTRRIAELEQTDARSAENFGAALLILHKLDEAINGKGGLKDAIGDLKAASNLQKRIEDRQ